MVIVLVTALFVSLVNSYKSYDPLCLMVPTVVMFTLLDVVKAAQYTYPVVRTK